MTQKTSEPPPRERPQIRTGVIKTIARGDIQELRDLLDLITDPKLKKVAQEAIEKFESKAGDWISMQCKGSINREFPERVFETLCQRDCKLLRG